jgi:hypothetical protein
MSRRNKRFLGMSKQTAATAALAPFLMANTAASLAAQDSPAKTSKEGPSMTVEGKFYCNIKALTPDERARHKQLGEKLTAARKEIVETDKGYEFQYSPADISLAELAQWVAAESKCCPFFDFHLDVERQGTLLCLRLTGEEGIKAFIQAEFGVK